MLFKALKANSDKYTLGNMHFFLNLIWNENSNTVKASPLMQEFKAFVFGRYSNKFINKETVAQLDTLINNFRNESAHTGEMDKNMAISCMDEVRRFINLLVDSEIVQEKKVEVKPTKKKTGKTKSKQSNTAAETKEQYELFDTSPSEVSDGSKVTIKIEDGTLFRYHISGSSVKGSFTGEFKQISITSKLGEEMIKRKLGDTFEFGGVGYEVVKIQ